MHLIATDLNPSAAQATAATLAAHGIPHAADVIVTDLITSLEPHLEGLVDLLLFNPPYVPTPDEEVAEGGIAAAWAGGYRGRRVVDRLLPLVPQLLSPTGQMLLVAVSDNDIEGETLCSNESTRAQWLKKSQLMFHCLKECLIRFSCIFYFVLQIY